LGFSGNNAAFNILMAATDVSEIDDIIYQIQSTRRPEDLK
jgi:hypothetical protein